MGREEDLLRQLEESKQRESELRKERRESEHEWRLKVEVELKTQTRMLGDIKSAQDSAKTEVTELRHEIDNLNTVVCGAFGKEEFGMSARLRTVETYINEQQGSTKAKQESQLKVYLLALGALFTALFTLGRELLKK